MFGRSLGCEQQLPADSTPSRDDDECGLSVRVTGASLVGAAARCANVSTVDSIGSQRDAIAAVEASAMIHSLTCCRSQALR